MDGTSSSSACNLMRRWMHCVRQRERNFDAGHRFSLDRNNTDLLIFFVETCPSIFGSLKLQHTHSSFLYDVSPSFCCMHAYGGCVDRFLLLLSSESVVTSVHSRSHSHCC